MELDDLMMLDAKAGIGSAKAPDDDDIAGIAALAEQQIELEAAVMDLEKMLDIAKKKLTYLSEVTLPDAMSKVGMLQFRTKSGFDIKIEEAVYASIKEERSDEAFDWLRATNNDGIIKNDVVMSFGKGQDAQAAAAKKTLSDNGHTFVTKTHIHWQTLRAFVKKELASGTMFPEAFSITVKNITKITNNK